MNEIISIIRNNKREMAKVFGLGCARSMAVSATITTIVAELKSEHTSLRKAGNIIAYSVGAIAALYAIEDAISTIEEKVTEKELSDLFSTEDEISVETPEQNSLEME